MRSAPQYTLKWLFFGFSGRIRRGTYMLAALFFGAVFTYLVVQIVRTPEDSVEFGLWGLAFFAALLVSAWASVALAFKRLHDMGYPGYLAVLMFIPMASLLCVLALCFWPGEPGANKYGASPLAGHNRRKP
jgi:uncharacterized membrane protein YhaH (DUF805 family)